MKMVKKFSFIVDVYHNLPDEDIQSLKDYVTSITDGVSEEGYGMDYTMFIRKKKNISGGEEEWEVVA